MVYVFDNGQGLVKIVKHGSRYRVYRVKEIRWWYKIFKNPMRLREKRYKITWEKRPIKTHEYKPYEDKDVSNNPLDYIEGVKRMQEHKISYDPFA